MWFFLALALLSQSTTHLDMAYAGTNAQLTGVGLCPGLCCNPA